MTKLLGPTANPERTRQINDTRVNSALNDDRERIYLVTVNTTDTTIRHDLREASGNATLIPFVQALGAGNRAAVVSVSPGVAVLRIVAGVSSDCMVRFVRPDRQV